MFRLNMLSKECKGLGMLFKNTFYYILIVFFTAFLNIGGCGGSGGGSSVDGQEPGLNKLNVEIIDAFVSVNREVIVTLNITDELGNPLSKDNLTSINLGH